MTVYQPIRTAPIDECVILATTGDWVGEACLTLETGSETPRWQWASGQEVHRDHAPLGWMPLPPPLAEPIA